MRDLTLVIPAKKEKESLPIVLEELKTYKLKILIVLEESDIETINSISQYDCQIIFQKGKGYGDAILLGLNNVSTEFFCIFNADGSFNPKELNLMYKKLNDQNFDAIFGTRYEKNCGSEDDTLVTFIGNYIFTKIGNIFFNLKISDILYTYVLAKTNEIKSLELTRKDFRLCVELPIKARRSGLSLGTSNSFERARISGKKKVNALKDGAYILIEMIRLLFKI